MRKLCNISVPIISCIIILLSFILIVRSLKYPIPDNSKKMDLAVEQLSTLDKSPEKNKMLSLVAKQVEFEKRVRKKEFSFVRLITVSSIIIIILAGIQVILILRDRLRQKEKGSPIKGLGK